MLSKLIDLAPPSGGVFVLTLLLMGCGSQTATVAGEELELAAFSVDLAEELTVPPPLVLPAALPGLLSITGVENATFDDDSSEYAWQLAEELVMEMELAGGPRPHELRIRAQPFPLPDKAPQFLTPVINGEPLRKQRVIHQREELSWVIPGHLLREGANVVTLRAAYAIAPMDVKPGSRDSRTLAYRIYGISIATLGRQGAGVGQVELIPKTPVTWPLEGAEGLQLQLEGASMQGEGPLNLRVTLSVDGAETVEEAYVEAANLEFTDTQARDVNIDLPLPIGRSAIMQIDVESERVASLLMSGVKVTGRRGAAGVPSVAPEAKPPRLVVLYVSDTTRADRLSLFGYSRPTSPNLTALVDEGAQAWSAHSNSSWTRPSVATMFTGLEQGAHGVLTKYDSVPSDLPVLAESLRDAGYRTVAFSGSSHVQEGSGFTRGFTRFVDVSEPVAEGDMKPRIIHFMDDIFEELDRNSSEPMFLFVHSIGPHDPYQAPEDAQKAVGLPPIPKVYGEDLALGPAQVRWVESVFRRQIDMNSSLVTGISALYDAEIWDEDVQIGRFVDGLKERGLWDDTMFVLTSDHGEEFGEHGQVRHGRTLWDEQLKVPLIIHWPKGAQPQKASTAGLLDIVPTLTGITGGDPIPNAQGRDLRATPPPPRFWHAEIGAENMFALWDDRFKLIVHGGRNASVELYDRVEDPAETKNILTAYPARVAIMGDAMDQRHRENHELRRGHRAEKSRLTETQEDRLRLLGYVDEDQ